MKRKSIQTPYVIALLFIVVLLFAVFMLMQQVQKMLLSDVRISLDEIVNQNKNIITSRLNLELNNINLVAKQLSDQISLSGNTEPEHIRNLFLDYTQKNGDDSLCWADADGNAVFSNGGRVNIAGRKYFQLAMQGETNVSEQLLSRLNGQDIFVFSVPLYYNGKIIGTIQKQYPPKEMYDLCAISLFSQQGSMYVINSDGYILISSDHNQYNESSNFYRMLFLSSSEDSKQLETDIRANRSGLMEVTLNGQQVFSAYTPVDAVHDWYLITSINNSAVMPNANIVVRMFYAVLFLVVLSFAGILFYMLRLKRLQQQHLETLAFVDSITKGDSYTKFFSEVPQLLASAGDQPYYILVFDIDGFHYINRFYGFDTGDAILQQVYQTCAMQIQSGERIARISADRFVAALRTPDAPWLTDILCSGITVNGISIYFSAGLYPVKDPNESLNLMIDKAFLAGSEIKGKRFKQIGTYSAEFDNILASNEQLKQDIDRALDASEFVPYFQPKVDIHTNQLVGAEALARWIRPDQTIVSPAAFIPISEQTGVIRLIDWMIFEKTLQFIKHNLDKGVKCVPISVNFSRSHLFDKDFLINLKTLLERYQVPGQLIEIELTETTIFDNAEIINSFIEQLHQMDLVASMDDFGSGYSSLHMLKDVNIDVLKIDQAFLSSAINTEKQQIIFETIAHMAKKLQLKTVVEGVETPENVAAMRQTECSVAQGYFYAKPMSSDRFEHYYQEGTL